MNLDDLVWEVDSLMYQIEAYPNTPRSYFRLYDILETHIVPKEQRRFVSTFRRKTTIIQIGDKYKIELKKGLFRIDLFVEPKDLEGVGVWVSIPILPPDASKDYGRYLMENGQRRFLNKLKYEP